MLKMFNNEQQQQQQQGVLSTASTIMDPRISFSNDFADPHQAIKYESKYREAPVSSDFEFGVKNFSMIPADEIFFKGMLLPLKDDNVGELQQQRRKLTLRDTLLVEDEQDYFEDSLPRSLQKGSGWWKDRLSLKKSNVLARKGDDRRKDGAFIGKAVEDLISKGAATGI